MNTSGLRSLGSITPKAKSESEKFEDSDVEMKTLVAAGSILEVELDLDTT